MNWFKLTLIISISLISILRVEARNPIDVIREIHCRAIESDSDAVLITYNGRTVYSYAPSGEWLSLEAMSITKAFVSLAIGMLIDEGAIYSVDTPVYRFYPEWNQGIKREITIRHLLSHTSGIQPECTPEEIYRSCDIIQQALTADLTSKPGCCYYPNNKAVNLLTGIIRRASGIDVNEYLTKNLLAPIGAEGISWACDPSGTPYGMAHMIVSAPTLAKVGWLLANDGFLCGRQLISRRWIQLMTQPCQCVDPFTGLLWSVNYKTINCCWDRGLLERYRCAGISPTFIRKLSSLNGGTICCNGCAYTCQRGGFFGCQLTNLLGYPGYCDEFYGQCRFRCLPIANWNVGCKKSLAARGFLGQQLIVLPDSKIVGVRQIRNRGIRPNSVDCFDDFECLLEQLAQSYCW